jgi:hypothetical protein
MCEGFLFFWRPNELGDSCRPREFPQFLAFEEGGVFVLFVYNLIQRFHTLNLVAMELTQKKKHGDYASTHQPKSKS